MSSGDIKLPSLQTMAANLISTAYYAASGAISHGTIISEKSKADIRMEMCEACEFAIKKDTTLVCGKCGCWMQAKVKIDASKCPVGKW
jgi:hypothetical protein